MPNIHPTAIIGDGVELGSEVSVGAYSIINGPGKIGAGTVIDAHVQIYPNVEMGEGNMVHHGVTIGSPPQDLRYKGEPTKTKIGNSNVFRECVTVHRASKEDSITKIGDKCFFMVYSHVAHDDQIGDGVVLTNCTAPAGWVSIDNYAVLSAWIGVHQYCRVGTLAMVGALTKITKDVPPYCIVVEDMPAKVMGLNIVGLKRIKMPEDRIKALSDAYEEFFRSGRELPDTAEMLKKESNLTPEIKHMIEFIETTKRGVIYLEKKRTKDFTFI